MQPALPEGQEELRTEMAAVVRDVSALVRRHPLDGLDRVSRATALGPREHAHSIRVRRPKNPANRARRLGKHSLDLEGPVG